MLPVLNITQSSLAEVSISGKSHISLLQAPFFSMSNPDMHVRFRFRLLYSVYAWFGDVIHENPCI